MIGLDTNVLVRFIVQDDPKQSRAASRLVETKCTADEPGWISQIVLCELVWVLVRGYGYNRDTIASIISRLLTVQELRVENAECAWRALIQYEQGRADFADCLIGEVNRMNGVEVTYTFDQRAADGDLFRLVLH